MTVDQNNLSEDQEPINEENCPSELKKFWHRRYNLFSLFDYGIKLDQESLFSVTPECIANFIASTLFNKCKNRLKKSDQKSDFIAIDLFCGAGGDTIQLASKFDKVYAIDLNSRRIEFAKNNAEIYAVDNKIEFIQGDSLNLDDEIIGRIKGDVTYLSPPWGGLSYNQSEKFDMNLMKDVPIKKLADITRKIAPVTAFFLPKNIDLEEVRELVGTSKDFECYLCYIRENPIAYLVMYENASDED